MKLMSFLGVSLAAALLFALPAAAAVAPTFDAVPSIVAPTQATESDCVASLGLEHTILFIEASEDCDVTMAELTGLCLSPVPALEPLPIVAVLAPELDISCTTNNPSPPG